MTTIIAIIKHAGRNLTSNSLAPYGVFHPYSWLSLLVETNHFPERANFNASTQLSCDVIRYLSGLLDDTLSTSIKLCSIPTASQSPPDGEYPNEKICESNSYCCNWRPSRTSQQRTVLSRPPVHTREPSGVKSIQLAPSVWPSNCLKIFNQIELLFREFYLKFTERCFDFGYPKLRYFHRNNSWSIIFHR